MLHKVHENDDGASMAAATWKALSTLTRRPGVVCHSYSRCSLTHRQWPRRYYRRSSVLVIVALLWAASGHERSRRLLVAAAPLSSTLRAHFAQSQLSKRIQRRRIRIDANDGDNDIDGDVIACYDRQPENDVLSATPIWCKIRGGTSKSATLTASTLPIKSSKKKKAKKKKDKAGTKAKKNVDVSNDAKDVINQGLLEKDAAQALGDAIRDRASQLQANHQLDRDDTSITPAMRRVHESMQSVGYALGASDRFTRLMNGSGRRSSGSGGSSDESFNDESDTAGIEVASASVVVHYFLKSHGGAHALQCLCSALSATAGLAAVFMPLPKMTGATTTALSSRLFGMQRSLLQRCLLFAMIKHISGLGAALYMAATQGIPTAGFRQTFAWIQELVANPVSHYVFYAALLLVWLPSSAAMTATVPVWWQSHRIIPLLLVGPVVLREVISTALVVADVLVLWAYSSNSSSSDSDEANSSQWIQRGLAVSQSVVNAWMSILVTPSVWRTATAVQRQAILAKLVSKISLVVEVAVGIVLLLDALVRGIGFLFLNSAPSSTAGSSSATSKGGVGGGGFLAWLKSLICARLYVQFLWMRRRKLAKVLATMRGGAAARAPLYMLTVLADPLAAMGIVDMPSRLSRPLSQANGATSTSSIKKERINRDHGLGPADSWKWIDYLRVAMGWD